MSKNKHNTSYSDKSAGSYIGLSNCPNLTATFTAKVHKSGEGQAVITNRTYIEDIERIIRVRYSDNLTLYVVDPSQITSTNKPRRKATSNKKPPKRKGPLRQKGLTKFAKREIRNASAVYDELKNQPGFAGFSSFITLSFRNTINIDADCKKCLLNFQKRLRRKVMDHRNSNIPHFIWVAERQERGVLHFHELTPEVLSTYWLNRHWNRVCLNYAKTKGMISASQVEKWEDEILISEKFNIKNDVYYLCKKLFYRNINLVVFNTLLDDLKRQAKEVGNYDRMIETVAGIYKKDISKRPKGLEGKTEFLLTPNLIPVNNVSRYMAKYMSKGGMNIEGNLWFRSRETKRLSKPIEANKHVTPAIGNQLIEKLGETLDKMGVKVFYGINEFNGLAWLWCANGSLMYEVYCNILEAHQPLSKLLLINGDV